MSLAVLSAVRRNRGRLAATGTSSAKTGPTGSIEDSIESFVLDVISPLLKGARAFMPDALKMEQELLRTSDPSNVKIIGTRAAALVKQLQAQWHQIEIKIGNLDKDPALIELLNRHGHKEVHELHDIMGTVQKKVQNEILEKYGDLPDIIKLIRIKTDSGADANLAYAASEILKLQARRYDMLKEAAESFETGIQAAWSEPQAAGSLSQILRTESRLHELREVYADSTAQIKHDGGIVDRILNRTGIKKGEYAAYMNTKSGRAWQHKEELENERQSYKRKTEAVDQLEAHVRDLIATKKSELANFGARRSNVMSLV